MRTEEFFENLKNYRLFAKTRVIASTLGMTPGAVKYHLRKLKKTGLIKKTGLLNDKNSRYYLSNGGDCMVKLSKKMRVCMDPQKYQKLKDKVGAGKIGKTIRKLLDEHFFNGE